MTYVCFLCPFERECFSNEIQELRNGRLSSLSGKSTSRSCRGSSFQWSPISLHRLLQLLQQTCTSSQNGMNQYRFRIGIRGASSPCNGNHFLVITCCRFCQRIFSELASGSIATSYFNSSHKSTMHDVLIEY